MEGIAALLGSENGSRYRGVSQLQSHQSRYSVPLSFCLFAYLQRFSRVRTVDVFEVFLGVVSKIKEKKDRAFLYL